MSGVSAERFQIGLDEAGYGPLLGPLTTGVVRVDGPAGALKAALGRRLKGMPRIDDSKRLFSGPQGFARLERTALAAVTAVRGATPRTVAEFFESPPVGLADHDWYGSLDAPLPRSADPKDVSAAASAVVRGLGAQGAVLAVAAAEAKLEADYNARCVRLGNKGAAHLEHMGDAMLRGLRDRPAGPGRVDCDRLGGRKDYSAFLAGLFPFRPFDTMVESDERSRYEVRPESGLLAVSFLVGGETASPAIALASCLAKYARELLMEAFNAHFARRCPGLLPTAGYWEDGLRFLNDLVDRTGDAGWPSKLRRIR